MTGAELREARERRGISREIFADLMGGESEKRIRHWEDTAPPEHAMERICNVLDMYNDTQGYHPAVKTSSGVRFGWRDLEYSQKLTPKLERKLNR